MYKALLIEDYPVIQELYGKVLEQNGFEVDYARDGMGALKQVKEKQYDVVLLDLLLPDVNGIEFLQKFTDRGDTKVVVLSDFDYADAVKNAYALGVSKYWIKAENTPHVVANKLNELLKNKGGKAPPAPPAK